MFWCSKEFLCGVFSKWNWKHALHVSNALYNVDWNTHVSLGELENAVETVTHQLLFPQHFLFSQTSTCISKLTKTSDGIFFFSCVLNITACVNTKDLGKAILSTCTSAVPAAKSWWTGLMSQVLISLKQNQH